MKIYRHKGVYGEDNVYALETLEDWDEYEKYLDENKPDWRKYNPNFFLFKEDFKKYIGKIYQDTNQLRYCLNGEPVYRHYRIIGIEDDDANADWYWVVQNVDDDRDIKYVLGLRNIKDNII